MSRAARKGAEPEPLQTAPVEPPNSHLHEEPASTTQPSGQQPKRPVFKQRIGRLHCDVWENHHPEQGPWYSVSLSRHYRDANGVWQTSTSFGHHDLLVIAELCRTAFIWIAHRQDGNDT